MSIVNLNCPVCHVVIKIDVYGLLNGAAFHCENCKAGISMKSENKEVLQNAMEQFETLKKGYQQS